MTHSDVQWSVVYIAGGHILISSRVYERVDVHGKAALIRGLHQRHLDLVDVNSDLVKGRSAHLNWASTMLRDTMSWRSLKKT